MHDFKVINDDTADCKRVVTSGVRSVTGWGFNQFITDTYIKVESCTSIRRHINNDCLTFRMTKIVVHSV